jgi:hypothetical protein
LLASIIALGLFIISKDGEQVVVANGDLLCDLIGVFRAVARLGVMLRIIHGVLAPLSSCQPQFSHRRLSQSVPAPEVSPVSSHFPKRCPVVPLVHSGVRFVQAIAAMQSIKSVVFIVRVFGDSKSFHVPVAQTSHHYSSFRALLSFLSCAHGWTFIVRR